MLPEPVLLGLLLVTLFGAVTLAMALGGAAGHTRRAASGELDEAPSTQG